MQMNTTNVSCYKGQGSEGNNHGGLSQNYNHMEDTLYGIKFSIPNFSYFLIKILCNFRVARAI